MKLLLLFCVILAFAACAADDKGTNKVAVAALTLSEALKANLAGTRAISPAWTGRCEVVSATGIFQKPEPPVMATNRYRLKFDTAVFAAKGNFGNVGPRGIARAEKDGGISALYSQRDVLPAQSQIQSAVTLADLMKILGAPQGFPTAIGLDDASRTRVDWRLFTLNGDILETLQVAALVEREAKPKDARIDSLEIVTGKATPERKPAEKKS